MASKGIRLASSFASSILLLLPSASLALEPDLKELEVRLNAHRRELMQRENDLDVARLEIRDLKKRMVGRSQRSVVGEAPAPAPVVSAPAPESDSLTNADGSEVQTTIASLQHDLDIERENRETLEQELQRVATDPRPAEALEPLRKSLEGANALVLVLRDQALAERRAREALEVDLERARKITGIEPSADWLDRFAETMNERRVQAARLEQQLGEASETIVALKARIEATSSGPEDPEVLQKLQEENGKLRSALSATEQANTDLRTQADLASHLAEMLYGQSQ